MQRSGDLFRSKYYLLENEARGKNNKKGQGKKKKRGKLWRDKEERNHKTYQRVNGKSKKLLMLHRQYTFAPIKTKTHS